MGPGDINTLNQRKQALDNARAQLAAITGRTQTTTECIRVLVEAGAALEAPPALLVALCKVQLAQLRMAEAEGLQAIANLTQFIKVNESPLFGATLIPPVNKTPGRH